MEPDLGVLRERLTIRQPNTTTNDQGETVLDATTPWTTLATVWGRMRPLSVREQLDAEQIGSHMVYEAEIRYRADVTPKMQIQWTPYQGAAVKTLEILGVLPKAGRPDRSLVTCAEVR